MKEELKNKILENAISLDTSYFYNFGYKKLDALKMIEVFRDYDIVIVGGSVHYKNGDIYKPLGEDNWSITKEMSKLKDENNSLLVNKSIELAKEKIEKYNESNKVIVYSFVTNIPKDIWNSEFYEMFPTIKSLNNF